MHASADVYLAERASMTMGMSNHQGPSSLTLRSSNSLVQLTRCDVLVRLLDGIAFVFDLLLRWQPKINRPPHRNQTRGTPACMHCMHAHPESTPAASRILTKKLHICSPIAHLPNKAHGLRLCVTRAPASASITDYQHPRR